MIDLQFHYQQKWLIILANNDCILWHGFCEFFISHFQVLYFVDDNGNEVLSLGSMVKVSEETIRNILCRESLIADEFVKFQVIPV